MILRSILYGYTAAPSPGQEEGGSKRVQHGAAAAGQLTEAALQRIGAKDQRAQPFNFPEQGIDISRVAANPYLVQLRPGQRWFEWHKCFASHCMDKQCSAF